MLARTGTFDKLQCLWHKMLHPGATLELWQLGHPRRQTATAFICEMVANVTVFLSFMELCELLVPKGLEVNLLNQRMEVVVEVKGDW